MFYGFSLNFLYGISNKSIYLSKASEAFVIMVYSSFTGKTSFLELETGTTAHSSKSENSASCNNVGQGAIFRFSLLASLRVEPCGEWAKMIAKIYSIQSTATEIELLPYHWGWGGGKEPQVSQLFLPGMESLHHRAGDEKSWWLTPS